ncbi:ABC transporter substrate-binding protein [Curtobacterium sp. MCBD17_034]|uniref:ABC transporter substrate-binding protein n=1 Tax=unclassified Curtobacterium TaxID=257496 RepID=UPI000DA84DB9|nr:MULTISPECIES: ABC transporter substrate-binding protein [unclassified Curtobacterium]PZE71540.1 ABC transporter substrate-binding protein [Curtobacterium sp. MCBD17_019]PZF60085.1 ABC transporter substrate-binding protein [Curtobacterium sp. MCBD17_034]PZM34770.1 ABC transporter substrate-binding protein [Curtobacterium sp. MCBD17_031]
MPRTPRAPRLGPARIASVLVAATAASVLLAGCGTSSSSSDAVTSTKLTGELPAAVTQKGSITVAGDASYPPIGYYEADGTTLTGVDYALADALGKELGIQVKEVNASFDSIIPGLAGGKYDVGMSWINDTDERRKVVDFVDYSKDGASIFGLTSTKDKPTTTAELCGHSVAVQKGTSEQTDAQTAAKQCTAQGKGSVSVQVFPDQSAANLAVKSGRADVSIADTPVAAWQVRKSKGAFELAGEPYGAVYHGIAVKKGSGLAKPLAKAFQKIMDDGTYARILKKWGMSEAAIDAPLVNGQPLS